ncbi:DExH-box ATP-dependent RNA helicase DExH1 isoform X2 [Silene latifolia]|uniref:DExH-box ATP-dependent RNA helicase DExH1 isoform X2 n=1 Tax=Silene latifolia TaxID=37657 RepID=UPI003D776782
MSLCHFSTTSRSFTIISSPTLSLLKRLTSTFPFSLSSPSCKMSYRPNHQGGRRGAGGRRGGGGRGGGRGGGGEQRWWDPVWRAQRLAQKAAEYEVMNENEWWNKMEEFNKGGEQEMVIKRLFNRQDQEILNDMAHQLGLYFHAYNKGKTLVASKVPLPNYRADLDERHGTSQNEIRMSTDIERRVGSLLDTSKGKNTTESSSNATPRSARTSLSAANIDEPASVSRNNVEKERISLELKQKEDKLQTSESVRGMRSFREKLPAFQVRAEFLKSVAQNQVLVVSGETGCGKTTQLPQFILEKEISLLCGADCNIICTQPRRIAAISVAARISSERGENLGETVGYQIRLETKRSAQTRLLFCTTGVLLRQLVQDPNLTGVSHLLVDEIHERGMYEDFLLIILKDLLPRRPDLRLILMSATINAELFSQYFGDAPTIHIPGLTFPVTELFLEDVLEKIRYNIKSDSDSYQGSSRRRRRQLDSKKDPLIEQFEELDIASHYKDYSINTRKSLEAWSGSELDLGLVEATMEYICRHEGEGAILVFLTGWDEISKLLDQVKSNRFLGDTRKYLVLPLHGSMPTVNQREIFDRPPPGTRKIVLATNIAESSITIDDVVYVIDCGKAKETSYDALNKLACLLPSWISKASSHQRRGRAGRVQPGVCYRFYPRKVYDAMPQYQLPEILRTPLQELCLNIKSLQLGSVGSFLAKALQPPDSLSVQNALELLKTIGALDDTEELTPLGRHLCTLPLEPNIGKMLLMGSIFQCLNPALTIAAALAYRNPFVLPIDRKEQADAAKRSFAGDSCSDHIALLKAYEGWKEARHNRTDKTFCWENFLSSQSLQMIDDMRKQFVDLLSDIGFVNKAKGPQAYNTYSDDMEMVCAILCAGLYPNVVQCKRRGKRTAFYTKEVGQVDIHPASINAGVHSFPLPYMVYSEKVKTTSIYIRDSTNISDYALLLFGGNLLPSKTGEGIEMLGGYLHFSSSKSVLELIKKLRAELDKLLNRKIEEPRLDIHAEGKGVVAAVVELLNSQNVRY